MTNEPRRSPGARAEPGVASHREPSASDAAHLQLRAKDPRRPRACSGHPRTPSRIDRIDHTLPHLAPRARPKSGVTGDGDSDTRIWLSVGDDRVTMVPVGRLDVGSSERLLNALGACLGLDRSIRIDLTHTVFLDRTCARILLVALRSDVQAVLVGAGPQPRLMLGLRSGEARCPRDD
jgi:anti-anti-sigma regulatory factor